MTHSCSTSERPLRILHVLEATGGGTMRYMENIAEATENTDMVFAFAYGVSRADSRLAPFLEKVKGLGWLAFPIDMRRNISVRQDLTALLQLRRAVRDFAPDLIHCHSSKAGALGRAAASLQRKSPVRLYSPHALAAPLGDRYLTIERFLARCTDRFVAVSESEREQVVDFALASRDSISVAYPSIDCEAFSPRLRDEARTAVGIQSFPTVVSIGRLTEQKDPSAFVAVIKRLRQRLPNVRALWVGAGHGVEADQFRQEVAAADLNDTISVIPWTDDVRSYLAAADVFLSTSRFESFGYVTAEALAMELPAVASDVTGTRDIMTGNLRPWLYPSGDHERAADLLLHLLTNPEEARRLGQLGRNQVKARFSRESMREALLETYADAMASREATSPYSVIRSVIRYVSGFRSQLFQVNSTPVRTRPRLASSENSQARPESLV